MNLIFLNTPYFKDEFWSSRDYFWRPLYKGFDAVGVDYRVIENDSLQPLLNQNLFKDSKHIFINFDAKNNLSISPSFLTDSFSKKFFFGQDKIFNSINDATDLQQVDTVITSSPDPFFYTMKSKLVLSNEVGIFSRPPFAFTQFFDPFGFFSYSLIGILSRLHDNELCNIFNKYSDSYFHELRKCILNNLKFSDGSFLKIDERKKLLFPDYNSHATQMQFESIFRNQLDSIKLIHKLFSSEYKLIFTTRPGMGLDSALLDFLVSNENDIELVDVSSIEGGQSTFLIPYVDAVYSINSTLSFQAVLFEKDLIVPADSSHKVLAKFVVDERCESFSSKFLPDETRVKVLSWLICCYFLPNERLVNGDYFVKYMDICRSVTSMEISLEDYLNSLYLLSCDFFDASDYLA